MENDVYIENCTSTEQVDDNADVQLVDNESNLLILPTEQVGDYTNSPENEELSVQILNTEELYSCYNCNMTFFSIDEHVRTYHKGQEIVIEMDDTEALDVSNNEIVIDIVEEKIRNNEPSSIIDPESILSNASLEVEAEPMKNSSGTKSCILVSDDDLNIEKHTISVENNEDVKKYSCAHCCMRFNSESEQNKHKCEISKGIYKCSYCSLKYNDLDLLKEHIVIHKKNLKFLKFKPSRVLKLSQSKIKCEICMTIFKTTKSLQLHRRIHYPLKNKDKETTSEFIENNVKNDFLCSKCNRHFLTKENLEMHVKVHATDKVQIIKNDKELPYQCNYCDRQFPRPHEKIKHERIHTGEKPYVCEICHKTFRVSYCLTLHMRTHSGARPYTCQNCGKKFKSIGVYNHHILTHSDVRAYKCTFCPKAFKTAVQLAGHRNSHTKPYSCTECNRPFSSLYAVKSHMSTHRRSNNLKFKCHVCGATYARNFALKDHFKEQHSSENVGKNVLENELSLNSADLNDKLKVTEFVLIDNEGTSISEELDTDESHY